MRITPTSVPALTAPARLRWASGIASMDSALSGGLTLGSVHEIYTKSSPDKASATGFAATLAIAISSKKPIMWLQICNSRRQCGLLQAAGLAELGGAPGSTILGIASDALALLRMAVEAVRCPALGAVIIEGHGRMAELDLTASRCLALSAEKSGVTTFILRCDAQPRPSAAQTRWQVRSAHSQALPGNAPGNPVFDIELLRQRSGPSGLHWRLEWDRDERIFRDAAHGGAMVPVPACRSLADAGNGSFHTIRRHAA